MKENQPTTGGTFINLALYAFLGLGMEVVVLNIEGFMYGIGLRDFTQGQHILHWLLTCAIWTAFAVVLTRASKEKYQYDVLTLGKDQHISPQSWILAILLACVCIGINAIGWGTLNIIGEFAKKSTVMFFFQYLYYFFEVVLILLIVCFGQRAGEKWFPSTKIPWGGITVGLTWGLVHALTKGSLIVGLSAMSAGVLYGIIYLLLKKKYLASYLFILLAFTL